MESLVLKSPAKLNLYLDVLRKRPDGYHDIETVFEKIALFDSITLRPIQEGIKITTNNPALPTGRANLAYKAARALFDKIRFKKGIWIDIKKAIPLSAGLGGGSSNAATVLSGANRLFKLGLARPELVEIGKTLGADVPFFLYNYRFAIGRGRGDEVYNISNANSINMWHIIVTFDFGLATKGIYKGLNLRLTPGTLDVKITPHLALKNGIENLAACLYNKLEEVAFNKAGIIAAAKEFLLKEGALGAVLSGSGPTVFGITKTREEAIAVKRRISNTLGNRTKILIVETFN